MVLVRASGDDRWVVSGAHQKGGTSLPWLRERCPAAFRTVILEVGLAWEAMMERDTFGAELRRLRREAGVPLA
ncbi:hypothetical protein ACFQ1S_25535, partial [Kibdelosporangium lantanae]